MGWFEIGFFRVFEDFDVVCVIFVYCLFNGIRFY